MKIKNAILTALMALAGCDHQGDTHTNANSHASQSKGKLDLADGGTLLINAVHMKSYERPNKTGKLSTHEFSYSALDKIAENDIYMKLKRSGYTRKVISNSSQYKVQYYKKDAPTIGGIYTSINQNAKPATIATLYWQVK